MSSIPLKRFSVVQQPGASTLTTNYNYAGGPGLPGITRSYVDPLGVVGDMISPWPKKRSEKQNNAIVAGLTESELETLNSNIQEKVYEVKGDKKAEAFAKQQQAADNRAGQQAWRGTLAEIKAEQKRLRRLEDQMKRDAIARGKKIKPGPEVAMTNAPQNVPADEVEVTDAAPLEPHATDIAPQAAPAPDAQDEVFEDAQDGIVDEAPPTANEVIAASPIDVSGVEITGLIGDDDISMKGGSPTLSEGRASAAPAIAAVVGVSSDYTQHVGGIIPSQQTEAMEGVAKRLRDRAPVTGVDKSLKTEDAEDVRSGKVTRGSAAGGKRSKGKGSQKGKGKAKSLEPEPKEEVEAGTFRKKPAMPTQPTFFENYSSGYTPLNG